VTLKLQPVRVAEGEDGEGCLVFRDEILIAVLVRLSAQHEGQVGSWFFEKGFGALDTPEHPVFEDLDAASLWIQARL
jgi:hypothetical protein